MNLNEINCKEIFQKAYEKRYTWGSDFKGYKGKCAFSINDEIYEGSFILGKDFKPEIHGINNESIKKGIASQLFEVSIHRVKREFEYIHAQNKFNFLNSSDEGIEMIIEGKNEGDKYRVKNDCINMVYRKIHGTIIEIFVHDFLDTGSGFLSKKYASQQINPKTLEKASHKLEYQDNFIKIESQNCWILKSRFIKFLNETKEEEIQKFYFDEICLLP